LEIAIRLSDLPSMHPRLLWDEIMTAFVATSIDAGGGSPFSFFLETINLPNYGDRFLQLSIDLEGVADNYVVRVKRTYEPSRLVELAAIAIAGLALFQAGNHEIRDIALRGTGADYLVDETNQFWKSLGDRGKVTLASLGSRERIGLAKSQLAALIYV
jgi:hypothetical protein